MRYSRKWESEKDGFGPRGRHVRRHGRLPFETGRRSGVHASSSVLPKMPLKVFEDVVVKNSGKTIDVTDFVSMKLSPVRCPFVFTQQQPMGFR